MHAHERPSYKKKRNQIICRGGAGVQPQRSAPMHIIVCVGMIMEQALVPVVFLVAAIQLRCTSGVAARRPSGAEHVNKIIIESM